LSRYQMNLSEVFQRRYYKKAKLQAGIKLTALCLVIDKENSIEFPLDFLYYLYNYYMVCALLAYAYHVTYHVILKGCKRELHTGTNKTMMYQLPIVC